MLKLRWLRRLLPGWIWLEPTVAEARIALNKLQPVEPPELARKRAHRVTAPINKEKTMTSRTMLSVFVFALGCAGLLAAQSVHFVKGPTFADTGTQLLVTGKLAGLGNGDVTIIVDADGVASVECTNPGGNVAPGQDTSVSVSGSVTLPSAKNGHVNFAVLTNEPAIASTPACPNPQWTATATDVAFTGGTITVLQGGVIVLQQVF